MSNLGKGIIIALCMLGAGFTGYSIAMEYCKNDNEIHYNLGKLSGYCECALKYDQKEEEVKKESEEQK